MIFEELNESSHLRIAIQGFFSSIGISIEYFTGREIPVYSDAKELVPLNSECSLLVTQDALSAWQRMEDSARLDNVEIIALSTFRSFDYQKDIIRNKIDKGHQLEDIFHVSAPPGFSEHHTGQAIDIGSASSCPFTHEFETTDAFHWLNSHAHQFNFHLSYPEHNNSGFAYEPWHWRYHKTTPPLL